MNIEVPDPPPFYVGIRYSKHVGWCVCYSGPDGAKARSLTDDYAVSRLYVTGDSEHLVLLPQVVEDDSEG